MSVLLNLLKAFGIVLGAYLLLIGGIWAIVFLREGMGGFSVFGFKEEPESSVAVFGPMFLYFGLPVLLAFGALYLPPKGRLYAVLGALCLIVGIWTWFGIRLNGIRNG